MEKIEPIFLIKNYDIIFWDFDGVIKESLNAKSEAFKLLFQNESIEVQNFIENHHMNNGGVSRYEKMPIYLNYAGKFFNNDIINDYCDKFSSLVTKNVIESNWVNGVFNFLNKNYNNKIFCVLTATPQIEIEYILKELEISIFFKFIIGYPTKKEMAISNVLKNYGISKNKAVMIGDSISDFNSANINNIDFVLRLHDTNNDLFTKINSMYLTNFNCNE